MKKLVITALAILTVFGLSACGNVQTADKNVETSATTSASANTVTTVTTSSAVTSVGDVVTTAPISTSEGEPIVTTSATTSTAPEEVETTTTTVATKKPVTTTTKKATTTTAKKTTTTAKKTTTTAKKTNKVTTTTTAKKQVKLTQSDIDRLVKELQEYANSKCDFDNFFNTETEMVERISYTNTDNGSWGTPFTISTESEYLYLFIQSVSYDEILDIIKSRIDYMYSSYVSGGHIVVYQNWCPDGEAINSKGKPAWEIYLIY